MKILLFGLVCNALLFFKVWWDSRAKSNGRIINHELSAGIDITIYVVSGVLLFGWDAGGFVLFALSYRWLMFDLLFNHFNGWDWDYYGNSSVFDRFLQTLGKWHLVPKILILLFSILLIWLNWR